MNSLYVGKINIGRLFQISHHTFTSVYIIDIRAASRSMNTKLMIITFGHYDGD